MSDSLRERRAVGWYAEYERANARAEHAEQLAEELVEVAVESCNAADRRVRSAEACLRVVCSCLVDAEEELEAASERIEEMAQALDTAMQDATVMQEQRDDANALCSKVMSECAELESKLLAEQRARRSESTIYESQLLMACQQRDSVAWNAAREVLAVLEGVPWMDKKIEAFIAKYPKLREAAR